MFGNCNNILSIDVSHFDYSKLNDIEGMFDQCSKVKFINLTNFNPPKMGTLWNFARNCYALTSIDMTNCCIKSASYRYCFMGCSSLISLDLSKWKYSDIAKTNNFISNSGNLILLDISNFDTNHVTTKGNEFSSCNKLKYLNLRYYTGIDIFNTIPKIKNLIFCIENIDNLATSVSLRQKGATNNCSHICFQRPIIVNPFDENCYYDCPKLNEGQFCNYDHTEILTEMPEGYFLNDTYEKTIDKCYYLCKYCINYGDEENNNCTECISNYNLLKESNYKTNCY